MHYNKTERRIVRIRFAALLVAAVLMFASVIALSAATPAVGATMSPHDVHENSSTNETHHGNASDYESAFENESVPENVSARSAGNASVNVHFDSDEGLAAEVECGGNVTASVIIEVLDGTYDGESTYTVTCDESLALPAPEEAVTLRITVVIDGHESVRVIDLDPEKVPTPDAVDEDREQFEDERQRALERLRSMLDGQGGEYEMPEPQDQRPEHEEDDWNDERDQKQDNESNDDERDQKRDDEHDHKRNDDEKDDDGRAVECTGSAGAEGAASADAEISNRLIRGSSGAGAQAGVSAECTHD